MHRIMYVENKSDLDGEGRIGWVEMSRSGRSFRYGGRTLAKVGGGYKYNCVDAESGTHFWVSGPRRDGADKLYGGLVQIDEDARIDYWTKVRNEPSLVEKTEYRAGASTRTTSKTRRNERSGRGAAASPKP